MAVPFTAEQLWEAWERVQENAGCAGTDGVTVEHFARRAEGRIAELLQHVAEEGYRPYPLLKIVVEKKPGGAAMRRLLVPSVRDRILQTAVARYLSRSFEEEFLECSYGYRPGRSVDRAIARIRKCHELGYKFVVDTDVQSYFDNVDHRLLLDQLSTRKLGGAVQGSDKREFGYAKVRCEGLKKNTAQIVTLFALSNLWIVRHQLMGAKA